MQCVGGRARVSVMSTSTQSSSTYEARLSSCFNCPELWYVGTRAHPQRIREHTNVPRKGISSALPPMSSRPSIVSPSEAGGPIHVLVLVTDYTSTETFEFKKSIPSARVSISPGPTLQTRMFHTLQCDPPTGQQIGKPTSRLRGDKSRFIQIISQLDPH